MSETVTEYQINGKTYIQYHGNAFDRGSADSWYHRPRAPHIYPKGSYNDDPVLEADMSPAEIEAIMQAMITMRSLAAKKTGIDLA